MARRIKVDFYRVSVPDGSPPMEALIRNVQALPEDSDDRVVSIRERPLRLQHAGMSLQRMEGELMRIDMDEIPRKGKRTGEAQEIDLEDDEGIAEDTAFLFWPQRDILLLERNRRAVTGNAFARYFEKTNNLAGPIILEPVIRAHGLRQLNNTRVARKILIKIAPLDNPEVFRESDTSTKQLATLARRFGSPHMTMELSMGHSKGFLAEGWKGLIRDLRAVWSQDSTSIEKLVINGRTDDDEKTVFDLLKYRMEYIEEAEPYAGRRVSYSDRKDVLRRALEMERQNLLQQFAGRQVE